MAAQNRRKQKMDRKAQDVQVTVPGKANVEQEPKSWWREHLAVLILVFFGVAIYLNTVPNKYAFDDSISVTDNNYTKSGISGIGKILSTDYLMGMWGREMKMYEGGRYRPLSLVTLAIEYQFFGENPHVSHLVNALMHGLTACLLFWVLTLLFNKHPEQLGQNNRWFLQLPFLITLLFLAHPIHTEVVANIKGRDEVMMLLGSLAAWYYTLLYVEKEKIKYLVYSGIYMFLGLMSKENAITFLAVIPLSLFVFMGTDRKKILIASVPILVASIIFLRIRWTVVGGLPDNDIPPTFLTDSFVGMNSMERYATTFYTYLRYLILMFFPHPLTYDYYPYHIPIKTFSDPAVWASLAIHVPLLIYALIRIGKRSVVAFGILYFWITFSVVSNFFFSIGVFMSERFVYAPSLGFLIALVGSVAFVCEKFIKQTKLNQIVLGGFFLMVIGFSIKTVLRNRDWKDSFTLFTTDVKVSHDSIKSTAGAGELLLFKARKTENKTEKNLYYDLAIEYFTTTVKIFPDYIFVLQYLGDAYLERYGNVEKALEYYKAVFITRPDYVDTYTRIDNLFKQLTLDRFSIDQRIQTWEDIRKLNDGTQFRYEVNLALGRLYGPYKNDLPKAIECLEIATKEKPEDIDAWADLGTAYSMKGRFADARVALEKVIAVAPNRKDTWANLAIVYSNLGLAEKARDAALKAK